MLFALIHLFAQNEFIEENSLKNYELKGYAESAERYNDKITALKYYEILLKRNPENQNIKFKTAGLYFDSEQYKKAKSLYVDLLKTEQNKFSEAIFNYGVILKKEEQYDSAVYYFNLYRDEITGKSNKDMNLKLLKVDNQIKACENILYKKNHPENIKIVKLNNTVNKPFKESSPIIYNDSSLIYTSVIIDSTPLINIDKNQAWPEEKYFLAKLQNNEWIGSFDAFEPFINLKNKSVTGGCFSEDGKRFYFSVYKKNIYGELKGSIYVSVKRKNGWSSPKKLSEKVNSEKYFSIQPTLGKCYNPDLDVIYFVSDRPGGFGGTDIWYTVYDKRKKEYNVALNAGFYINTPGNEITPFYDKSTSALYFSSDMHSGYGGYDIFKTYGELMNWIPPLNIGKPLNSGYNDFFFTKFKNDTAGFIVSNRSLSENKENEHCCYDLFEFSKQNKGYIEINDTLFQSGDDIYKYLVDKKTTSPKEILPNTVIKLHVKNKENGEYVCLATDTTDSNGRFHFKVDKQNDYKLTVEKEGYTPTSVILKSKKLYSDKLNMKSLTIIPDHKKSIKLSNIYFDFNKWDLNEASKQYIDTFLYKTLLENKGIVIEIDAYTDGIGDDDFNLVLSKKRAESVVKYLSEKGIDKSRLIAKGFGESKPIVREISDTGEDIPEGRAKNRRIEFRVVGIIVE